MYIVVFMELKVSAHSTEYICTNGSRESCRICPPGSGYVSHSGNSNFQEAHLICRRPISYTLGT